MFLLDYNSSHINNITIVVISSTQNLKNFTFFWKIPISSSILRIIFIHLGGFFIITVEDVTFINLVYSKFTTESGKENHEVSIQNRELKFFGNKYKSIVLLSGVVTKKGSN